MQFNDVHCAHGQTSAVHQAADRAVERDVVEIRLLGANVERFFLAVVGHGFDIFVAEQRVVIEVELRINRNQLAGLGDDQRIDFHQRSIGGEECFGETGDDLRRFIRKLVLEAKAIGDIARDVRLHAERRMKWNLQHFFR